MANKKFEEIVKAAEAKAMPGIEASRKALEDAQILIAECEEQEEAAEVAVAEIEADWQRLNDNYTAADHAAAESERVRSAYRLKGAKQNLAKAERAVLNSDTSLAEVVAEVVSDALPDVPVISTFLSGLVPEEGQLPLAVVVQSEPSRDAGNGPRTGAIAGKVEVFYHRGRMHRPLDSEALTDAFGKDASVNVVGYMSANGSKMDHLKVTVNEIAPYLPSIAKVAPANLERLGSNLAGKAVGQARARNSQEGVTIRQNSDNRSCYSIRKVTAVCDANRSDEKVENGRRTIALETSIVWEQREGFSNANGFRGFVEQAAADMVGSFVPGVGRIVSAEIVNGDSALWHGPDSRKALSSLAGDGMINAGRVGYEEVGQAVVRFLVESTTA